MSGNFDTGVSNGDVDWLFRGKSKKLTKQMNLDTRKPSTEHKDKEGNASKGNEGLGPRKEHDGNEKEETPKHRTQIKKEHKLIPGEEASKERRQSESQAESKGSYDRTSDRNSEKSKLEKVFGRNRSNSAGSSNVSNAHNSEPPKRRGSFHFIGGGPVNQTSSSETFPASTEPERDMNQHSAKHNSSGRSRSLFGSISARFRSNSATSSGAVNNSGHSNSPPVQTQPSRRSSTSKSSVSNEAELIRFTDEPPPDIPKKTKRRTSSSVGPKGEIPSGNRPEINESKIAKNKKGSLRRVTFAINELAYDPQQQIPSKRPQRGNVIIPEEVNLPPPRLSLGISTSDGRSSDAIPDSGYSDLEIEKAHEARRIFAKESEMHAQTAYLSAKRLSNEVSSFKYSGKTKSSELFDEHEFDPSSALTDMIGSIEIDKPLHVHEKNFEDEFRRDEEDSEHSEKAIVNSLSLETIYTRCCHLREILPIPATLRQLKNKNKPLHVLKMLNPKPTLIDILSFSDFVSITKINSIIFDNVTINSEMLKILLSSIIKNKYTEKLSLRNVAIDQIAWNYICEFVQQCKTLKKLDISQQKVKADTKNNCLRSNMKWDKFIDALAVRGGIEELVINGCKLSDSVFQDLIERAVKISTQRLGIASVDLNIYKSKIVANWVVDPDSKCLGVDIAFNDLSNGQLQEFTKIFKSGSSKLMFFSLNSTNLSNVADVSELLYALTRFKTLRFLDLSSLPDLFPGIISKLNKYLPLFEDLRRIHFDLNDLSVQSISALSDILPKAKRLLHVSMLGNPSVNGACVSLYGLTKHSKTLFTLDIDYSLIPDELSQRMAFYLMRNLGKDVDNIHVHTYNGGVPREENDQEELMFDGKLLMENAERMLVENEQADKKVDLKTQIMVTNALIERTKAIRNDVHNNIDNLFQKRNEGVLTIEGKETLLRLCLLDTSLEKLVHMFEDQAIKVNSMSKDLISPSTSISDVNTKVSETDPFLMLPQTKETEIKIPNETLHQSSNEFLTAGHILSPQNVENLDQTGYFPPLESSLQPHQVVVESTPKGCIPVDNLTGRPVLLKSSSHTSLQAKIQEEEEGELHRFRFFMEQKRNDDEQSQAKGGENSGNRGDMLPKLSVLPSGHELRDSIIAAKGIESVKDLIENINQKGMSIDKILKLANGEDEKKTSSSKNITNSPIMPKSDSYQSDNDSIDSAEGISPVDDVNAKVDEVYEKLLNDAQRVRSNKTDCSAN